jgi:archaellin
MENENWKTVTEFPNYEVSDLGNIRIKKTKYIMKPFRNEAGYLRISISNDICRSKKFYIQRLVAIEFLPNLENKPTVNHKNNKRDDNRLCNLEWSTMSEQNIHKHKTNNKFQKRINVKAIWRIDLYTLEKLEKFNSTTEAAKWIKQNNLTNSLNELNLRQSLINVSNGKNNSAYGYKWSYENDETNIFENEIWKEIAINNYLVSNYGRIKNNKGEICKLKPNAHGYIKISIKNNSYSVHRLVALAFIPNIENKKIVNHIDGNKINNNLKNLEWATCLENNIHKINNNLSNNTKKVIQYDSNMNKLNEFISITYASKQLNLSKTTITNSCNKKIKFTRKDNFIFRFG